MGALDSRTCEYCGGLDGIHYPVENEKVGINYPPLHANCRCTTVPYYPDLDEFNDTKVMTYKEWKESLKNEGESGIINIKGNTMKIDKFTPCLENAKTGGLVDTAYAKVSQSELEELRGWQFDWLNDSLKDSTIFKLTTTDAGKIQGLIALEDFAEDKAIYAQLAESAPNNIGKNKDFFGVGGHLFAIAAQESKNRGYGGFVFLDAKNMKLVEHYAETLGATFLGMPHPYRMFIDVDAAEELLAKYTLKGE